MGTVSFYSKVGSDKANEIGIRVNDSVMYKLIDKYPTPVRLPAFAPTKVCIAWGSKNVCDLILANPFEVIYYELVYNSKSDLYELEKRNESQVRNYTASHTLKKP